MMKEDKYLEIIEKGLSERRGASKKVIVVGAGMAGLVAADLLQRAGHEAVILEARSRVGGRIKTVRQGLLPGLRAEMGAMRIPLEHQLTMAYVNRFNLETAPFTMDNPETYVYLQGKKVRRKDFDPVAFAFDVHEYERGKTHTQLLAETLRPLRDLVNEKGEEAWEEILDQYDQYSLSGFLVRSGWSEGAIELLGLIGNVESRMNYSFVEWLRHHFAATFSNMVYLTAGSDALPQAFLASLGRKIKFGASLEAIEQLPDGVTAVYMTAAGRFRETGDYMIITVPFSILRHIEVTPAFSHRKFRAIRQLNYDSSSKIFVQCSRRFWEEDEGIYGGGSITDLAIRNVFYPEHGRETGRGALLASYTWGKDADVWSNLSEHYLTTQAIENLSQIHPQIERTFEVAVHHHWGADPYAGGVGALREPGQLRGIHRDIVAAEGHIHFAGDHCSLFQTRWIQGAIEAAIEATVSVHNAP